MNSTKNYKFSYEFNGIEIFIFFVESETDIEFMENCNEINDLIFIETDYYIGNNTFNFYIINFDGLSVKFRGLKNENLEQFYERVERVGGDFTINISWLKIKLALKDFKLRYTSKELWKLNRIENDILNFVAVGEKRLLNYEYESENESDIDI
jgi:hypothetical protein